MSRPLTLVAVLLLGLMVVGEAVEAVLCPIFGSNPLVSVHKTPPDWGDTPAGGFLLNALMSVLFFLLARRAWRVRRRIRTDG